jgi:hypothetical protein
MGFIRKRITAIPDQETYAVYVRGERLPGEDGVRWRPIEVRTYRVTAFRLDNAEPYGHFFAVEEGNTMTPVDEDTWEFEGCLTGTRDDVIAEAHRQLGIAPPGW